MTNERPPHYVKEWRKHRGLTQERLAARMDKTQSWVSQLERFEIEYTQGGLQALSEALSCEPGDLLTINPLMAGEVVDITALLRGAPPFIQEQALAAARAVLQVSAGGAMRLYRSDDTDDDEEAAPSEIGRISSERGTLKR